MRQVDKADDFAYYWSAFAPLNSPQPDREYRFVNGRKYKFDFAWEIFKVAVEIDGGTLMVRRNKRTGQPVVVGRHNLDADRVKCNLAVELGWRVLHYSPAMLKADPRSVIEQVCMALSCGMEYDAVANEMESQDDD